MASVALPRPWVSASSAELLRGPTAVHARSCLGPLVPRLRLVEPSRAHAGVPGVVLGFFAAAAASFRSKGAHSSRSRRSEPGSGVILRAAQRDDLDPGERLFRQLYRSSDYISEVGGEEEEDGRRKSPRKKAAWKEENARQKENPAYGKKYVLDPTPRRGRGRRFEKGEVVDETQDMDRSASRLRTMYKRPRFGWKEVNQDDLRTSNLTGDMPAIGTGEVWLSKFLAHAGACSRRTVNEVVLQGRVTINGEIVQDPVVKVNPRRDIVALDGREQKLRTLDQLVWIMLYKPKDVITTMEDSEGRKTIMDLIPWAKKRRLVPVGRIDRNATGLILLTNDYEWHTILAHPRYEVQKRYKVDIYNGVPSRDKMKALELGLKLPDEPRPLVGLSEMQVLHHEKQSGIVTLGFILTEGKYRQILRMFEYIGHPVKAVKRTWYGMVQLDRKLKPGEFRMLTPKEVRRLKGPTILKRPTGDPFKRQQQLQGEYEAEGSDVPRDSDSRRQRDARGGGRFDRLFEGRSRPREERRDRGQSRARDRIEPGRGRSVAVDEDDRQQRPPAREATLQDLQSLEQTFGLGAPPAAAKSASGASSGDDDWEASWIRQLDDMQAEKSGDVR